MLFSWRSAHSRGVESIGDGKCCFLGEAHRAKAMVFRLGHTSDGFLDLNTHRPRHTCNGFLDLDTHRLRKR